MSLGLVNRSKSIFQKRWIKFVGRIETRRCKAITGFQFITTETATYWFGIKQVVKVESTREFKNSDKPTEKAIRHYISSLKEDPGNFQKASDRTGELETNSIGFWIWPFLRMPPESGLPMPHRTSLS